MASPYLMAYNALLKINPNYEVVAKTCNISTFRIIKDVIIPCSKITIREMIAYFFINSMVTISAVTFLFNTDTMPLSLMINIYEGNMMLGEAAIVSLIILFFNFNSIPFKKDKKQDIGIPCPASCLFDTDGNVSLITAFAAWNGYFVVSKTTWKIKTKKPFLEEDYL